MATRKQTRKPAAPKVEPMPALPKGIIKSDLARPGGKKSYESRYRDQLAYGKDGEDYNQHAYDLWYVPNFGWCLPTL